MGVSKAGDVAGEAFDTIGQQRLALGSIIGFELGASAVGDCLPCGLTVRETPFCIPKMNYAQRSNSFNALCQALYTSASRVLDLLM